MVIINSFLKNCFLLKLLLALFIYIKKMNRSHTIFVAHNSCFSIWRCSFYIGIVCLTKSKNNEFTLRKISKRKFLFGKKLKQFISSVLIFLFSDRECNLLNKFIAAIKKPWKTAVPGNVKTLIVVYTHA